LELQELQLLVVLELLQPALVLELVEVQLALGPLAC
jgi:hypothetical protein